MPDRNPYAMLGIPFGATRDVATRAFALRARGQRRARANAATAQLTDLTWALNQVTESIRDPRTALAVYRVPADPVALHPTGEGVMRPGPEIMPRSTTSSDFAWARLLEAARAEAVAVIHAEIASIATLPER